MRYWFAGFSIPQYRCFTLIRNTNRSNIFGREVVLTHDLLCHRQLRCPNFIGIMLNPARVWKKLRELLLRHTVNTATAIKQDGTRTCRALIDCENVLVSHANLEDEKKRGEPRFSVKREVN